MSWWFFFVLSFECFHRSHISAVAFLVSLRNLVTNCTSQVPPGIHEPQNQKRHIQKIIVGYQTESEMLRRHLDAPKAMLAQVGIQASGWSFRCICHLGTFTKTSKSQVLFGVYIAWLLLLVAQSWSEGKLAAPVPVRSQWWNMGTQLGRSQPRAGLVRRLSRALTSLCPTSCLSKRMGKRSTSVKSATPAMSRRSTWVSWSDSPREQALPSDEDAVMEDCKESHNMPEEHRAHARRQLSVENAIHGRREGNSAGRQKAIPTLAKSDRKTANLSGANLERYREEAAHVWKSCRSGSRQTRNWSRPSQSKSKPNEKWRFWWQEQTSENAKAVNQGVPVVQTQTTGTMSDKAAQQTIFSVFQSVLSVRSMECHSVEQLMAAGATEEDVKKVSQILAHNASRTRSRGSQALVWRCGYRRRAAWTSRARKPSREAFQTRTPKKDVNKKEMGYNLLRLCLRAHLVAGLFYLALSRVGDPSPVCATAKLYDAQFDEIGQWAANLTNKCEVELVPRFAQELDVKRGHCQNCSVSQNLGRFSNLQ